MVSVIKITFRTDASLAIGTGHVMRCLALARSARALGAVCRFITRALPGHMGDRILKEGFDMTLLPAPRGHTPLGPPNHAHWAEVDWVRDAEETRAALDTPPDWLVMDHYALDARWQHAARPEGTKLMVIDDLADRPHDCDLLLDQNLGRIAADYDGLVPDRCTRLTGPRYALLRPEFAQARAAALADRAGRGFCHLLITMGGVDPHDATSQVLRAVQGAPLPESLRITVVMGSQAPALDQVRALARDMPRPTEIAVDVTDMAARMASSDLAIGAAGSTTWERCALGLPTIIVQIADNQAGIARALSTAGTARDPGPLHAPEFAQKLQAALAEAPSRFGMMVERAAEICDGDGAVRVVAALCSPAVSFRAAERGDSRRVWDWRRAIDPAFNMTSDQTAFEAHDLWFRRGIESPDRQFRIMMIGELACGYLRLDRIRDSRARVSICLSPDTRGQGLGHRLLDEANALGLRHGITRLDAEIHPQNMASRRVFDSAGYVEADIVDGFLNCHRMLEDAS